MRRHLIIPDTQVRPGVDTSHIDWAAQAIVHYKPDVIVHLGDHWDFPSLNRYEKKGGKFLEGARYMEDVEAGNEALRRLLDPARAEIARIARNRKRRWNPEMHYLKGNHDIRPDRLVSDDAVLDGVLGSQYLDYAGMTVHEFLEIIVIDGISYSHFFQNINSSKAIGGSIDNRLNKIGTSFVQGHEQGFLYGNRTFPSGQVKHGLVAGSFYLHDEEYKGRQGNGHFRGIVVLNEVHDGNYSVMPVSIDYLRRKYG